MPRPSHTETSKVQGGCNTCHGGNVAWTGNNTKGLAARHFDQTRHVTWVETTQRTTYGRAGGGAPTTDQPRMDL